MSEVTAAKTSIESSKTKLQGQINSAKSSWKGVVSSNGLSGSVKLAIDSQISNYQIPLLTNYYDAMHQLSTEFTNAISDFKSTVKETSGSAIIDTDALTTAESKFSDQLTKFTEIEKKFTTIYDSVTGLVTVSKVFGSGFTKKMEETKKVLTETKKGMDTFNGKKSSKAISSILSQQKAQIKSLKGVAGLSYTDPKSLKIYMNKDFKNEINKQHKEVQKFEEEQKKANLQALSNVHPSMAAMKGTMTKAELDRIIRQMNTEYGEIGKKPKNEKVDKLNNKSAALSHSADLTQLAGQGMLSYRVASSVQGPAMSNGKPSFILVNPKGKGQALSKAGTTFTKYGGKAGTILTVIGFGTGVANDMTNHGKTAGQAITHNGASVGIGILATVGAGLAFTGVGAIVIGIGAAWYASTKYEQLYENKQGSVRKSTDKVGEIIDSGWKNYNDSYSKQMKAGMTRGV
ncbi:hypothetical protein [Enterococcus sp. AZ186]